MIYLMPRELEAITQVVDYLYDDEKKDFEASDEPKNHIFRSVRALKRLAEMGRERCQKN